MRAAVNHETGITPHKQENDKEVAKAAAIPVPEESDAGAWQASARSLRAFCCAFYKRHREEYSVLWDGVKAGARSRED